MSFKFNPRQIFMRKENAEDMIKQGLYEIPFWNEKLKSPEVEQQYLYYMQVSNYWMLIKLYYTTGAEIDKLSPLMEELVNSAEIATKFWQEHKYLLSKERQNMPPYAWYTSLNYLDTLGYISMCYLLHREDLLESLLQIILDNENVNGELDGMLEDLFYYKFKDRPDHNWTKYHHAVYLTNAIRSEGQEQLDLLHQYMKDWYKEMVGLSDIEYNTHLTEEQYGYYGYWAFEVATVIYLEDLDDSSFRKYPYYPKDLVDWARAKKREKEENKEKP